MSMTQGYGSVQPHHGYASSHHQQQPMATPLAHTPTSVSSYSSHYQHPVALLQPSINSYSPNYTHFPHSYGTPVTSPPSAGAHGHGHGHYAQPTITLPAPNTAPVENPGVTDATGQSAPPGMKPKVTATLWEDEGTLCFQVEARGICVARREDNHMINGTKLLNVAQMTRGRRDGILKSEKLRNVIKIGPMHLKGVWIPFDRALDFANREKIADMLYPLFVHNIGAMLQTPGHPTTAGSRRSESQGQLPQLRTPTSATSVTSQSSNAAAVHLPQTPHSIAPYLGRPGFERSQTFPTPPASAVLPPSRGAFSDWHHGSIHPGPAEDRTRSLPTTPATTPPDAQPPALQSYSANQSFDSQGSAYSAPQSQPPYSMPQISHHTEYAPMSSQHNVKHEMAPPSRSGPDAKEEEGENEYAHHNSMSYSATDRSYNYPSNSMAHEAHAEIKTSPSQQHNSNNHNSGHATPRALATPQSVWPTYAMPQRSQTLPSTGLTYDNRGAPTNGYSAITPATSQPYNYSNGVATPQSNKRGRDTDDDDDYNGPLSRGGDDLKRRRIAGGLMSSPMGIGAISRPRSTLTQRH